MGQDSLLHLLLSLSPFQSHVHFMKTCTLLCYIEFCQIFFVRISHYKSIRGCSELCVRGLLFLYRTLAKGTTEILKHWQHFRSAFPLFLFPLLILGWLSGHFTAMKLWHDSAPKNTIYSLFKTCVKSVPIDGSIERRNARIRQRYESFIFIIYRMLRFLFYLSKYLYLLTVYIEWEVTLQVFIIFLTLIRFMGCNEERVSSECHIDAIQSIALYSHHWVVSQCLSNTPPLCVFCLYSTSPVKSLWVTTHDDTLICYEGW